MKILKFGGKSLANGNGIAKVLNIISQKNEPIVIVVSARGNATDNLIKIVESILDKQDYIKYFEQFKNEQQGDSTVNLEDEFNQLSELFKGIKILKECSSKTMDKVLSFGEIISSKWLSYELKSIDIKAIAIDSGDFFITDDNYGKASINHAISNKNTKEFFKNHDFNIIPIVTGFIAKSVSGERTTFGRNGSNYSATILANYLDAELVESYTHVDGIFSADPNQIKEAKKISELSYTEAAELAQFGANILHAKTIEPLIEKSIPLKILNTFGDENQTGTLISNQPKNDKVRAISALTDKALIRFEGKGLLGKVGVDARIFSTLQKANISVGMISQGSSERAIGVVIEQVFANKAVDELKKEFKDDLNSGDVDQIVADTELSILAIIGLNLNNFDKAYKALLSNKIKPILFNNTINGNTICILLKTKQLNKATHVIHGELFERPKRMHLAVIGHGTVGKEFINQVVNERSQIIKRKNIDLRIFAVSNSTQTIFNKNGICENWEELKSKEEKNNFTSDKIINFAKEHWLENLILVDNTSSKEIALSYEKFIENGFDIVSSNKIANTLSLDNYRSIRSSLNKHKKRYYYETNVGAGLPLIDTIRLLHLSGENIIKISGVFSGSLSFIFNQFSSVNLPFDKIVQEAVKKGYTEPDPREDLNGNDVARKLLILARELDFESEIADVEVQNLIPKELRDVSKNEFFERLTEMNDIYAKIKADCPENNVLRYVGDLVWDMEKNSGNLEVKLKNFPKNSPLGQIKGADSIFEIYTDSYGNRPLVIQGAGAGAKVTARGVFGDVLKLSEAN